MTPRRPVIGIIGSSHLLNEQYPVHIVSTMVADAVAAVTGGMPMGVLSSPDLVSVEELMELCDGFVFTGARANVHPEEYGEDETEAHGAFDRDRDRIALPLTQALVERGQPFLAICRGFQELAVAFGCTLHPEIRDLPGRENHRMPPDGTLEEKFALRHPVSFSEGGPFHRLLGDQEVMTNSLHGQGIIEPGPRVVIDGTAPDGTAEAIYIKDAPGFALGVQWHPEWQAGIDPVSKTLFAALGDAARAWAQGKSMVEARKSA